MTTIEKETRVRTILDNPTYLPEAGMRRHLHESLMKQLSGQDIYNLSILIELKVDAAYNEGYRMRGEGFQVHSPEGELLRTELPTR